MTKTMMMISSLILISLLILVVVVQQSSDDVIMTQMPAWHVVGHRGRALGKYCWNVRQTRKGGGGSERGVGEGGGGQAVVMTIEMGLDVLKRTRSHPNVRPSAQIVLA